MWQGVGGEKLLLFSAVETRVGSFSFENLLVSHLGGRKFVDRLW